MKSMLAKDCGLEYIVFQRSEPKNQIKSMHYKNGREAKNGDKVIYLNPYGAPVVGLLYDAVAGNNDCNGKLAQSHVTDVMPDLKACLHYEDFQTIMDSIKPPTVTITQGS